MSKGEGTASSHRHAEILSTTALAILLAALVLLSFATAKIAMGSAPSFDGAMNLEVARSISNHEGFRRTYAGREVFPHEIQTGAPYVLPAAVVFAIWGVGIPQAQIVNIAYFLLLLIASYCLVRQVAGLKMALFAVCTVVVIPGMLELGFNGYGEIPALALVLSAAAIYYRKSSRHSTFAAVMTGVLMALAVLTKTVMLIGAGALALSIILQALVSGHGQPMAKLRNVCAVAVGGLLTLTAMEIWRARALGGVVAWKQWWLVEVGGIFKQAGVATKPLDPGADLLSKFQIHLDHLSHDYRFAVWATALWLALLCLAVVVTLLRSSRKPGKWATLAILVCAIVYMAWWLLVTPTAKAWHRRIIDGMICGDIGMIMFAATWINDARQRTCAKAMKPFMWFVIMCVLALPTIWLARGVNTLAVTRHHPATDTSSLRAIAKHVHELPKDAYIFGLGWYSAPRVGLLSERTVLDFNDVPELRIQPGRPIYFIQEPGDSLGDLQSIRRKYNLPDVSSNGYELIYAKSLRPGNLSANGVTVLRQIAAADNYPLMRGFNGSEGQNGRWLTDDNLILLTPERGDNFQLVVYAPPVSAYLYQEATHIIVSFNGCSSPAQTVTPGTTSTLEFPLPNKCGMEAGTPANVRIEIDNLLNVSVTSDPRALGVLGKQIGFVPAAHDVQQNATIGR